MTSLCLCALVYKIAMILEVMLSQAVVGLGALTVLQEQWRVSTAPIGHYYMTLKGLSLSDLQWVSACSKGTRGAWDRVESSLRGAEQGAAQGHRKRKRAWSVSQQSSFASNGHSFLFFSF